MRETTGNKVNLKAGMITAQEDRRCSACSQPLLTGENPVKPDACGDIENILEVSGVAGRYQKKSYRKKEGVSWRHANAWQDMSFSNSLMSCQASTRAGKGKAPAHAMFPATCSRVLRHLVRRPSRAGRPGHHPVCPEGRHRRSSVPPHHWRPESRRRPRACSSSRVHSVCQPEPHPDHA